jgi:hypothetical protein
MLKSEGEPDSIPELENRFRPIRVRVSRSDYFHFFIAKSLEFSQSKYMALENVGLISS